MEPEVKEAADEPRPGVAEQAEARAKQMDAEARWRPEDAEWAKDAIAEHGGALFQAIFEKAALGIALVDLEGRIARANPALLAMFDSDDLAGAAATDLAHPEDAALDQRMFEQLVAGEHDHYAIEKRYRRADGTTLWGRLTASIILSADGLPAFVIGILEDISERVRAEEAVLERHRAVRDAYATVIEAVTGGQLMLVDPEEIEELAGEPLVPTQTLSGPEDIPRARHVLEQRVTELTGDSECVDNVVLASSEAMTNALRHAGEGTWELRQNDGRLQVLVRDKGPGIDFADLPRLALVPGGSTGMSLGMGFTIMLGTCARVAISTSEEGTDILLEHRYARSLAGAEVTRG